MESSPAAIPAHYTASTTNFSYTLFRELGAATEGNVFVSTYSVQLLLLLLTIGSKSKTFEQLTSVLRFPSDKPANAEKLKSIIDNIESPDYLTVANGIFSDKAFDLSADYENQARNYLKSEVKSLDFANNPAAGETEINKWTESKTKGKITKLFDSGTIKPSTVLVLASAVHFKSEWEKPFGEIKNGMFCLTAKEHIEIEMLHQTDYFNYYRNENEKYAVLELPYQNDAFDMLIVLPDKMDGVKALEKSFLNDSTKFPTLLGSLTLHKVVAAVPKFKFESDINLEDSLSNLGCSEMFTPGADFSKMSSSGRANTKVSAIKHKTFVDVNEKGTEAAAVTGAAIALYSGHYIPPNVKTVHFHACHPFLFIIKKGDNIIFMGRLSNPKATP